jgi:tRNA-splicing ligase RtcB (3'-phosphate/5'-hydroxy nucleic acid ligase)
MIEVNGKYASAKIFTDGAEPEAVSQVINLLNQPFAEGANVRVMPDTHAGAGCVIGFTANLGDKVIPNLVGVDIGCGMLVLMLGKIRPSLEWLDDRIHKLVPAGREIHQRAVKDFPLLKELSCYSHLRNCENFIPSIGTLGGGNHFIEMDIDEDENWYLVIHTGSRNLGKQVAEYHQRVAIEFWKNGGVDYNEQRNKIIAGLRAEKRGSDIPGALKAYDNGFKKAHPLYPPELCFLIGADRDKYLWDMQICQKYAETNRYAIAELILQDGMGYNIGQFESFQTVHNYINFSDGVLRKGAVSARAGEKLIIPMNMRDGALLCTGLGNEDWNYSAPHGAGRLMSRGNAKRTLSMDEFEKSMGDVYTTCVNPSTLDESPMAYKPMEEIIENIQPTVTIDKIIKPVYNFKAGEEK